MKQTPSTPAMSFPTARRRRIEAPAPAATEEVAKKERWFNGGRTAASRLFSCFPGNEAYLGFLDGLRLLSMATIYLGHVLVLRGGHAREEQAKYFLNEWVAGTLLGHLLFGMMFCVDSFLFIGGFLLAWRVAPLARRRSLQASERGSLWLRAVAGRVVRVLPTLLLVLAACVLTELLALLPIWSASQQVLLQAGASGYGSGACRQHWWQVAFLTGSLTNHQLDCFMWSWYLSADFVFFTAGTAVLLFLDSAGVLLATIALTGLSLYLTLRLPFDPVGPWVLKVPTSGPTGVAAYDILQTPAADWMRLWYVKPWHRFGAHGVGMLYGLQASRKGNRSSGWSYRRCFLLALALILFPLALEPGDRAAAAVWAVLAKPLWGVILGQALLRSRSLHRSRKTPGVLAAGLSSARLKPLARLSFAFYIWHPLIVLAVIVLRKGRPGSDDFGNLWEWALVLCVPAIISLVLAAANYCFLELPLTQMMRCVEEKRLPRAPRAVDLGVSQ